MAAAIAAVGGRVMVCSRSAAWLHRFITKPPDEVDLVVKANRHPSGRKGVTIRSARDYDSIPCMLRHGIPCTGVNRTLLDLARDFGEEELVAAIVRAIALRKTSLRSLCRACARRGRFIGAPLMRRVLALLTCELSHSRDERRLRAALRELGLRPHSKPYPVVSGERVIAEVDIAFPELRLAIEVDGPHHMLPEQHERDLRRDRQLHRLGWTTLRFTIYEIRRDAASVAAEIAAAAAATAATDDR